MFPSKTTNIIEYKRDCDEAISNSWETWFSVCGGDLGFKLGAYRSALLSEAGRRHCYMLFIYIFIYIKKSNFHAFSSVECIFDFVSHNIFVLVSLSSVSTQRVIKNLSRVSFCDGFGRKMSSIFFFLYSSFLFPNPFSFVYLFSCLFLSSVASFLDHLAFAPTFLPCVRPLPSRLTPMQHLSLWQTCAITRTLWTIARLPIKGVISPQWPMLWQGWAPPLRCQPFPVAPGPSATSMTVSSAQPVRRPSKDSRSD